ncbi:hypothetical protein RchiOBHm_Chr6g0287051 [Rosa chinensis]|uniref:Uncharacterized protein n=1 Tax=Rosa chinensis TaxID=74649 RepID=A0A2P6PUY7_ROSCH|nr:hypothetical protein RchiOBHm_Chr6g0287051 [Rosa chinensis]
MLDFGLVIYVGIFDKLFSKDHIIGIYLFSRDFIAKFGEPLWIYWFLNDFLHHTWVDISCLFSSPPHVSSSRGSSSLTLCLWVESRG